MQNQNLLKWALVPSRRKNLLTAILFLLPSLLVFGVFVYYALGFNVYLSFTSWNFLSKTKDIIGFDNYVRLFSSKTFWKALSNTAYFAFASVSISLVLGLLLAILLNQKIPARGLFRTIIFSPYVTTTAAISLLWVWIFQPDFGLFNFALNLIGIDGPSWLSNTKWAMPALIIMNVWRNTGYVMVIFLAGLQGIDKTLYEAAAIDGAGGWKKFLNVTLPLLSPTTFFIMVTTLLNNFNTFDQVAVMTKGGPAGATTVLNYFIYQEAFVSFRAGYASAASTVLFLILLAITIFQTRVSRRWVHY
jgi:ABC-type sugar transport system permease subunit